MRSVSKTDFLTFWKPCNRDTHFLSTGFEEGRMTCFPGPIEIPACITVLFICVDTFPSPIGILEIHVQNPILLENSQGLWATRIQLKKTDKQKSLYLYRCFLWGDRYVLTLAPPHWKTLDVASPQHQLSLVVYFLISFCRKRF